MIRGIFRLAWQGSGLQDGLRNAGNKGDRRAFPNHLSILCDGWDFARLLAAATEPSTIVEVNMPSTYPGRKPSYLMLIRIPRRLFTVCLAFLPSLAMAAAPVVLNVTDSATYGPRVAPGSLATLFGTDLAGDTLSASGFPLTSNLGGTTVSVAGTLAPLLYVSAGQINFQVPSSVKTGAVNIVVNGPGGASAAFNFTVTAAAPSIFQYGTNHALAQNADFSLNGPTARAAAASVITVYLTGQGAVDNSVADGSATPDSPLATAKAIATATIGPLNAPVKFFGLTPEFTGLAQANIEVPSLPTGDYPLRITAGGFIGASAVVSISGSGTPYTSLLTLTASTAFANPNPNNIALYNGIAYVCGSNRIAMVDVGDPTVPTLLGTFGDSILNGAGNRCAINTTSGGTPFLVDIVGADSGPQQAFAVFTLNNPRIPALLTVYKTPYSHFENLSFSGFYGIATTSYITYVTATGAIASQQGDFLVFSFVNPTAPVFVTALTPSSIAGSGNLNLKPYAEVVGNYAYVASSTATGASTSGVGTINVVDLTLPSAPNPLAQIIVPQSAIVLSFGVAGNTLLAAGNTAGQRNPGVPDFDFLGNLTLTSMDLTSPQLPSITSTLTTQTPANGTFFTSAFSNGVFAIVNKPPPGDNSGPSSLMIVDARRPASMSLYPLQTQFGFSGILTTSNGFLLAPTSLGLNVYRLQQ